MIKQYFSQETKLYRFFVWVDFAFLLLTAVSFLGALTGLILYLIPAFNSETAGYLVLSSIGINFICLTVLFFSNFYTQLFRKKTVIVYLLCALILILSCILCVLILSFDQGSFAEILFTIIIAILLFLYYLLPGYLSVKDLIELFSKLKTDN